MNAALPGVLHYGITMLQGISPNDRGELGEMTNDGAVKLRQSDQPPLYTNIYPIKPPQSQEYTG